MPNNPESECVQCGNKTEKLFNGCCMSCYEPETDTRDAKARQMAEEFMHRTRGTSATRFDAFLAGHKAATEAGEARIKELEHKNEVLQSNMKFLSVDSDRLAKSYNFDQQRIRDLEAALVEITKFRDGDNRPTVEAEFATETLTKLKENV